MKIRLSIWICSLLVLNVSAKDYYVSDELGNDSNNGLSQYNAFKTIQEAANRVLPGEKVYVMNGTYTSFEPEWSAIGE